MNLVFWLKTMYDILLFESDLGTLDTSVLGLVFFSCSAVLPCTIFGKMYGGCCRKTTKFQWRCKSLFAVYLENRLFNDKFIHPF